MGIHCIKPTHCGLVVMSAYVNHTVFGVIVGEITAVIASKGKFKHIHSRISRILKKLLYAVCKESQILGYKGNTPKCLIYCTEQLHAGSLKPFAVDSVRIFRRYRIKAVKPAKMVNSCQVKQG